MKRTRTSDNAMAKLEHLANDTSTNEILEILKRDGGLIIDNLVSREVSKQLGDELRPYLEAGQTGKDEFGGYATKRNGGH